MSSSAIVLPMTCDLPFTRSTDRLSSRRYSSTSWSSVFPPSAAPCDLRSFFFDSTQRLKGNSTIIPTTRHIKPTGRNEKNDNGSKPFSVSVSCITRLGGVPISVSMPPMLLAKAKGISSRLALILALAARLTTMGSIKATVPVLLTKAPIPAVTNITSRNRRNSLFPAIPIILPPIIRASPVWNTAPPTTKRPIIIITTEFEKPERASCGVRMPKSIRQMRAHKATMSERTLPKAKNTADTARITRVTPIYGIVLLKHGKLKRRPAATAYTHT